MPSVAVLTTALLSGYVLSPSGLHSVPQTTVDRHWPCIAAESQNSGWRQRLCNKAGTVLAAAWLFARPSGALCAELAIDSATIEKAATTVTTVKPRNLNQAPTNERAVEDGVRQYEINLEPLLPKSMAEQFVDRDTLFADDLMSSDWVEEQWNYLETIEQLAAKKLQNKKIANTAEGVFGFAAVGGVMWVVGTSLNRAFMQREVKGYQEEMEFTGGYYVDPNANDVTSMIDPSTGKNITRSEEPVEEDVEKLLAGAGNDREEWKEPTTFVGKLLAGPRKFWLGIQANNVLDVDSLQSRKNGSAMVEDIDFPETDEDGPDFNDDDTSELDALDDVL